MTTDLERQRWLSCFRFFWDISFFYDLTRRNFPRSSPFHDRALRYGSLRDLTLVNRYFRELTVPYMYKTICVEVTIYLGRHRLT